MKIIEQTLTNNIRLKKFLLSLMVSKVRTRPRMWLRILLPFYIKRGAGSVIYSSVRMDIVPFRKFSIGRSSLIESFSVINNMVGDVQIGDYSRVGIGNTIIGPVTIGSNVMLAQNVVVSGMDHKYDDIDTPVSLQGISSSSVTICDGSWIGANVVITKGLKIGKHSVVAAGSVVTRDVEDYCVVAGVPAKIIKRYNIEKHCWYSQSE